MRRQYGGCWLPSLAPAAKLRWAQATMAAFFIFCSIVPWLLVFFNPPISALPLFWLTDGMVMGARFLYFCFQL